MRRNALTPFYKGVVAAVSGQEIIHVRMHLLGGENIGRLRGRHR